MPLQLYPQSVYCENNEPIGCLRVYAHKKSRWGFGLIGCNPKSETKKTSLGFLAWLPCLEAKQDSDKKPTLKNYRFYSSTKIIAFTAQPENVDPSPSPLRAYLPSSFCLFEQAGRNCVIAPGLSRLVWELDLRPQK